MATELSQQSLQVTTSTAIMSLWALKRLIYKMLENRKAGKNQIVRGEQSLKKLNLQDKQLDLMTLTDVEIKEFRKQLNKYAVDFAVMKDKIAGMHTVFFKGQDINRVYEGLEKACTASLDIKPIKAKEPMPVVMTKAITRAEAMNEANKAHGKIKNKQQAR